MKLAPRSACRLRILNQHSTAEQCLRFLAKCAEGRLAKTMDESDEAYAFAITIQDCYPNLDQIRVYVLTDRQAKAKNFKPREVSGKTVKLEVMDIERLHRHWSEGKPRDELVVNFEEVSGGALPCVYVPGEAADYDYAMTVIPGEALRFVYEKYGGRLLEANVRSFLSATAKVNKGIRDTLQATPERFMAYNNGIVIVADEVHLGKTGDGGPGILWLKGMQIVNGGQTTASIYFSKKKNPEIDLRRVRVPAKIIALRSQDSIAEEALISDISRFANSQTSVKLSDLSANKPFHVQIRKPGVVDVLPRRHRSLVLRTRGGQLQHHALTGRNDTSATTPAQGVDTHEPENHQDGSGQVFERVGSEAGLR